MKTKKSYYLFIMLAVLIAHTVVLSMWLASSEPIQKRANLKSDATTEKPLGFSAAKFKHISSKDSTKVSPSFQILTLGLRFK